MKKKRRNMGLTALVFLMGVLCIGGCELAACRQFAPEQYEQITAPVRRGAQAAAGLCREAAAQTAEACAAVGERFSLACANAALMWEEFTAPEPEEIPQEDQEVQLASEPVPLSREPVTDPQITELRMESGQEVLTGGTFSMVYFNQGDEEWAEEPFGSDHIGGYGCGPTALAMVVSSMTETATDPAEMAQWAVDRGFWAPRGGSYLGIVEGVEEFGLVVESVPDHTPDAVMEELLSGNILVALMGPGHFTQRGHFIVIRGCTLSGELLVADPNSDERSVTAWDPQLVLDELSASTSDGAPLWVVKQDAGGLTG